MREESLKKNWTRWKPSPETPECLLMKNKLIKKILIKFYTAIRNGIEHLRELLFRRLSESQQ